MSDRELSESFLERLRLIKGKRARIVVTHILEHGSVTTEDLEKIYGYKHPPRAVQDVEDQGIPIAKIRIKSSEGKTIQEYSFGDPSDIVPGRIGKLPVILTSL